MLKECEDPGNAQVALEEKRLEPRVEQDRNCVQNPMEVIKVIASEANNETDAKRDITRKNKSFIDEKIEYPGEERDVPSRELRVKTPRLHEPHVWCYWHKGCKAKSLGRNYGCSADSTAKRLKCKACGSRFELSFAEKPFWTADEDKSHVLFCNACKCIREKTDFSSKQLTQGRQNKCKTCISSM